eukprot:g4503.t1
MSVPLKPNTAGCDGFEQHPFKKEFCRKCQKSFLEHEGLISDADLAMCFKLYDARIEKEATRKSTKAADEQKKTFEARLEKQKAQKQQEEEEDWFFDDAQAGGNAGTATGGGMKATQSGMSSPDDFKMMSLEDMKRQSAEAQKKVAGKAVQIKNLIDFEELEEEAKLTNSKSLPQLDPGRPPSALTPQTPPQPNTVPYTKPTPEERFDISQDFGPPGGGDFGMPGVGGGGGFGGMDTSELELQLQEAKLQCEIQKEEYENQIRQLNDKLQTAQERLSTGSQQQQEGGSLPSRPSAEIEAQLAEKETARLEADRRAAELRDKLADLQAKKEEVEERHKALEATLKDKEAGHANLDRIREEGEKAKAELKKERDEVLRLKAELRSVSEASDAKMSDLRNSVTAGEVKSAELANKVVSLEATMRAGREAEAQQLEEAQRTILAHEKTIAATEAERDKHRMEAEEVRTRFSQHQREEKKRRDEVADTLHKQTASQLEAVEEGHRAALEEQEQRHVAALAAEKDRNMRETEALKRELAEEGDALKEKLKTEAKGAVSSKLHFARHVAVIEKEKGAEIDALREELMALEKEAETHKQDAEEQRAKNAEIPAMQQDAANAKAELARLLQELAIERRVEKDKEKARAEAEQALAAKTAALDSLTAEQEQLEKKLFAAEGQLAQQKAALDREKQNGRDSLEKETAALKKRASELEEKLHRLIDEHSSLFSKFTATSRELDDKKRALASALGDKEHADREVERMQKEVRAALDESQIEKKLEEKQKNNIDLTKQLEEAKQTAASGKLKENEYEVMRNTRMNGGELGRDVVNRYLGEQKTLYTQMLSAKDELIAKYEQKLKSGPEEKLKAEAPAVVSQPAAQDKDTEALRKEIIRLRDELVRQKAEQKKLVDEAGRKAAQQAAKAFRDVRLNAEKQFGWLFSRVP